MLKAYRARTKFEASTRVRRAAGDASTEKGRRIRKLQRLTLVAQFGRASITLSQWPSLDAASASVHEKLRALHRVPDPRNLIVNQYKLSKTITNPTNFLAALLARYKDYSPRKNRAGVW